MKKVLVLINFNSGTGNASNLLPEIITNLNKEGCETTVYPIGSGIPMNSEEVIAKRWKDFDVILVSGGDGSLNHVINGMMSCGADIPIAYIPAGSTNDFASSITDGKTLTVNQVCKAVAGDYFFQYDIGKFNDNYFNYVAAFGAFSNVSYETSQDLKNVLGHAAYVLNLIPNIPNALSYKVHMKITHDNTTEEGDYIFGAICNTHSVGGVKTAYLSSAELDDGLFEVFLIKCPKNIVDVSAIVGALTTGDTNNPHIQIFSTKEMKIEANRQFHWTLDGEDGIPVQTIDFSVEKEAMKIMVPKK